MAVTVKFLISVALIVLILLASQYHPASAHDEVPTLLLDRKVSVPVNEAVDDRSRKIRIQIKGVLRHRGPKGNSTTTSSSAVTKVHVSSFQLCSFLGCLGFFGLFLL